MVKGGAMENDFAQLSFVNSKVLSNYSDVIEPLLTESGNDVLVCEVSECIEMNGIRFNVMG